jgi:Tol biopolymer transport system component
VPHHSPTRPLGSPRTWPPRCRAWALFVLVARIALGIVLAGLAACAPAAGPTPARPGGNLASTVQSAPLPADATGVLTYQRDGNVYALPLDTKAERKLTDFPPQSQAVFSARSPDGARLAYVRVEGFGSTLWLSDASGGDGRKVVDESASYATLEYPQWTPDSKSIVYTYHGFIVENGSIKGEVFRAERLDPDGGERTSLAPDAEGPTMAPDGSLAFVRTTRTGQQLVLLDPTGAERILIPERTFVSLAAPRFSLDGKRIAFRAYGKGPVSGALTPRHPGAASVIADAVDALGTALGPTVALAHGEPWDIWTVDVSGGVRELAKLTEDDPTVTWSPDSRYVAASGGTGVYVIEAASGQTTQLQTIGGFGGIDWTR